MSLIKFIEALGINISTLLYYPSFIMLYYVAYKVDFVEPQVRDKIINICFKFMMIPIVFAVYFLIRGIGNDIYLKSALLWYTSYIMIFLIGKDLDYALLGFSGMIFMSEYYEIPLYLQRLVRGIGNSYLIIIIPKLIFFIPYIWMMWKLDFNIKKYLKMFLIFTLFYIPITTIIRLNLRVMYSGVDYMFSTLIFYYIIRILNIGINIGFIYYEKKRLDENGF